MQAHTRYSWETGDVGLRSTWRLNACGNRWWLVRTFRVMHGESEEGGARQREVRRQLGP